MYEKFEMPVAAFGGEITKLANENDKIVAISADSYAGSGFVDFKAQHPDRFFEIGIMEQSAVGLAAGFACCGKIPFFASIAPFASSRPYEMLRNDLGYMRQNAKIIGRSGGITYSDLGPTHYSIDDFALMSLIPGFVVLSPQDPAEIRALTRALTAHVGPVYMRLGGAPMANIFEEGDIAIGEGRKLADGGDVTIISTGSTTANVLEALPALEAAGIHADVIGLGTIVPLDEEKILASAKKTGRVVTVEEHFINGGMGSLVASLLSEQMPTPVKKLGIPMEYAPTGPYPEVMAKYGLDAAGIEKSVKAFLG